MKNFITILTFFLFALRVFAQTPYGSVIAVSGQIKDENNEALIGASVQIKNTISGTSTDTEGNFSLKTRLKPPFILVVSMIGYQTQEFEVKDATTKIAFALQSQSLLAGEVVVSASRTEESILKSPVSIEKLDIRAIRETPSASFYDALENVRGVQLTTSSLTFKIPNTRGFNIPNNFRFMQLVDGVDMQAATLGVPLGNAIGATELDIESMEITPGAASALYGMNAINGMANLTTKSPFYYQGLSIYQKNAVNHIGGTGRGASILNETSIRYAKAFNDRFAFKINASFMQGTDWLSSTMTDQNPNSLSSANPRFSELNNSNPASDLWNRYGDERNNRSTVIIQYQGKTQGFNVARTGYNEQDLVNPIVRNLKFDGGLFYKINDKVELSYSYRFGLMDGVFQRGNKIQLNGVTVQNHKIELKGSNFLFRAYASIENTGNSYNLKPLADNLDLNNGSNAQWGARFQAALQSAVNNNVPLDQAMQQARTAADQGRVEAGTPAFEQLKNTIIGINNWDIAANVVGAPKTGGAWLKQQSNMYHADFQYTFDKVKFAQILVGADYRIYQVNPDGNNFVDLSRPADKRTIADANGSFGNYQYYSKYGAFTQITKTVFQDKLKFSLSLRVDQNPEFSPKFNPRLAIVYSPQTNHNFRVSFQNGWRFPALFEALSFVNNGNVRRVGGLAKINEGLGYLDNSYTLASIDNFTAAVNTAVAAGKNRNQAALDNRNILQVANLSALQPEKVNSFEVGYKGIWLDNKLSFDFDAYYNVYEGFLGQVEVAVPIPQTDKVGSDAAVLAMLTRAKQDRFRVFTNSTQDYKSYGSTAGLSYNFYGNFMIAGNLNYNAISSNSNSDVFVVGFNTPKWATTINFANREVIKNVGFSVVWRWQDSFLWESPLANGIVPAYSVVDLQANVRVPKLKTTVKLGASNLFNNNYIQYAAGPTLGGLYYVTLTFDQSLFK
ncbi:MAG: energy transducer TonB [Bacteroidetes bacterium]|nr:MAG: energy transducer TonB [Bacteroidota bacterium]